MIRWVNAGKVSAWRSQGLYHGLGHAWNKDTPDTIVLAVPSDPYICLGYFQDADKELDVRYCERNSLPVIRRETGGGAVYIDKNQLFVQWIFNQNSVPPRVDQRFQWFLKPMIETYRFFGIDAYYCPVNDVHVDGKKIVGTGAAMIGNAEVVTGNFILSFDKAPFFKALNFPSSNFKELAREGLEEYMSDMGRESHQMPEMDEVLNRYRKVCEDYLDLEIDEQNGFTDEEELFITQAEEKFKATDWLHKVNHPGTNVHVLKIHAEVWLLWTKGKVGDDVVELTVRTNRLKIDRLLATNPKANNLIKELLGKSFNKDELGKTIDSYFEGNMGPGVPEDWKNLLGTLITELKKRGIG